MESVSNFGEVAVSSDLLAEGACYLSDELVNTGHVIDTRDIYWNVPDTQAHLFSSWSA